jgi:hypothetical protein
MDTNVHGSIQKKLLKHNYSTALPEGQYGNKKFYITIT